MKVGEHVEYNAVDIKGGQYTRKWVCGYKLIADPSPFDPRCVLIHTGPATGMQVVREDVRSYAPHSAGCIVDGASRADDLIEKAAREVGAEVRASRQKDPEAFRRQKIAQQSERLSYLERLAHGQAATFDRLQGERYKG